MEEGAIKFNLHYTRAGLPDSVALDALNHWRSVLRERALIGQDPGRYDGYGYGNISQRLNSRQAACGQRAFVISGTQTGHLDMLDRQHYTLVESYDTGRNAVVARGPVKPSSESLTHGMIYDMDEHIHVVLHVHSPAIWRNATILGIPATDAEVAYGTPGMAREVERLFNESDVRDRRILSMGGHLDGIVSFGRTANEAGEVLLHALAACK